MKKYHFVELKCHLGLKEILLRLESFLLLFKIFVILGAVMRECKFLLKYKVQMAYESNFF